jgi:hypothetical protein
VWYVEDGNQLNSYDDAWLSEWEELVPSEMSAMDKEIEAVAREVLQRETT